MQRVTYRTFDYNITKVCKAGTIIFLNVTKPFKHKISEIARWLTNLTT